MRNYLRLAVFSGDPRGAVHVGVQQRSAAPGEFVGGDRQRRQRRRWPRPRPPILCGVADESLTALAGQQFVALTTFKRNGEGVVTPMWVGRDGDALFVWTPADAWKVKRVAHDPRVLLSPSGRFGKVRDGVTPVAGTAEVITEPATVERLRRVIQRKYGLGYWVITTIEAIAARGRKPRVILSISLSE